MEIFNVCDATRMLTNGHEFSINIYETFMVIYGHLCDAVGNGNLAS
jgi:hypothetical protein